MIPAMGLRCSATMAAAGRHSSFQRRWTPRASAACTGQAPASISAAPLAWYSSWSEQLG